MARVRAVMARFRELLQKNPVARYGLVILLVVVVGYLIAGRLFGGRGAPPAPTRLPSPPPSATPAPGAPTPGQPAPPPSPTQAPTPAIRTPTPPKTSVVPQGPTGRPDPFIPLVTTPVPGQVPGALPPPPFPPGPGQLPAPPLPGQVPGVPGGLVAVTGIVGNSRAVAVIVVGGRTEIIAPGDQIGDLRVLRIDSTRRTVTFLQAGRRFDVAMGGD